MSKRIYKPMDFKYNKIMHWTVAILFIVVSFLAIMNTTFYSKEEIISSFDFSFQAVDLYNVGFADKLFIARIERRLGWVWHFWLGFTMSMIIIASIFYNIKNGVASKGLIIFYSISFIMFLSGIPLYIRTFFDLSKELIDYSRFIHHYLSYIIALAVVIHIIKIIYSENKNNSSKISKMFKFKNTTSILILTFLLIPGMKAHASYEHYEIGMAFLKGEKGATVKTKVMPNCPYDFCKNAELMKKKMGVEKIEGENVVHIKEVDLKKALFFFEKAAYEEHDERGLDAAIKLLLGEINYKDEVIDEFLVNKLKKDLDLSLIEYKIILKNLFKRAELLESCYSKMKVAQFKENGYLNLYEKNSNDAKKEYMRITEICKKDRFEFVYALNKISKVK